MTTKIVRSMTNKDLVRFLNKGIDNSFKLKIEKELDRRNKKNGRKNTTTNN